MSARFLQSVSLSLATWLSVASCDANGFTIDMGSGLGPGGGGSSGCPTVLKKQITGVWSDGSSVLAARIDGSVFRFTLPTGEWKRELDPVSRTYPGGISGVEGFWAFAGPANDLWAVGSLGVVAHYDGNRWTRTGRAVPWLLETIWINNPSDIWAGGSWDTLIRYQSGVWTVLTSSWGGPAMDGGDFRSIWGADAGNVYASHRGLEHFDGSTWTRVDLPRSGIVDHIWGTSASDVYVVIRFGRIIHFDGSVWRVLERPDGSDYQCSVGGNGAKAASGPFAVCSVDGTNRVMEFRGGAIVGEQQHFTDGSGITAFFADPAGTIVTGSFCGTVSVRPSDSYWRKLP